MPHENTSIKIHQAMTGLDTLQIEGSFEELADELAHYIDEVKKNGSDLQSKIALLLERGQKDDALKKLVTGSTLLNTAPETGTSFPILKYIPTLLRIRTLEFIAAYNLLIHLVRQSPNLDKFLPKICQNLSASVSRVTAHGPGLALLILTTIFNILAVDSKTRYHLFNTILRLVRGCSSFETLQPQLKNLDDWVSKWQIEAGEQRQLYTSIANVAEEAGYTEESYLYLLRALCTIPVDEVASEDSRALSIRTLKSALSHPSHFDFQDLAVVDAVQALRKSDPTYFELLEVFNADLLDDLNDFKDEHDDWLEEEGLDDLVLYRKMRLLTLASLASSTQSRSLPYQHIARALQIPFEDVEMWVIDVIRAGLVEGKLSQPTQTFLIHRSTYRVFGEKQWTQVQARLDTWRSSLEAALGMVKHQRLKILRERGKEVREVERASGR